MDALLSTIQTHRNVKDSTLRIYKDSLNRLSIDILNNEYESSNFLVDDFKEVKTYLLSLTTSVRKKLTGAILVALSPKIRDNPSQFSRDAYNKYKKMLYLEQQVYNKSIADNTKSEKDEKNWVEWSEILKVPVKLKKKIAGLGITSSTPKVENLSNMIDLQDYLISCLYTMLPPRRLLYADATIIQFKKYKELSEDNLENKVFLVIKSKKKFFHFGRYAAKSATPQNIIINVPMKLNTVLNMWLSNNETDEWLLLNQDFEKLTTNALGKQLSRIFSTQSKHIGIGLIRKIFLSEQFKGDKNKKKDLAQSMNHSVNMQQTVYVKD